MKNSDYWAQRFKQLEKALHSMGEDAFKDIERQYREAQKQIEADIARWYQRLATNNNISLAEARKFLQGADLKEFKWDVWDYIKYGEENAINGQWMKELENASAKFHISRLEALKIQTQQSLEAMFAKQQGTVSDTMANVYESSYYHTAFEIQKGVGVGWDIAGLNQSQIEKVLSKPWALDKYNFSERIWSNKEKLINEIHGTLTQNIMLGQDPQKAIDAIAKKMNTSKYNAGRLVMTEQAAFAAMAQKECYKELDVEKFEVIETFDAITCEMCGEMDGKVFPMSEYQVGLNVPPFHPNCRGCTAPWFEDDFGVKGQRAARDIKTGETYYVPADMSYEEWKAQQDGLYGEGSVDKARKMSYNEKADKEQYDRYQKRLGSDAPKSFSDFQTLKYDAPEQYKELSEYYRYMGRVPEATKEDYQLYKAVKATGVNGTIRVPAASIDVDKLSFKDEHGMHHGCTLEEAKQYVLNAKCSIIRERWDGLHTNYYSFEGATYIHNETLKINTAYSAKDFKADTKEIMEVFK